VAFSTLLPWHYLRGCVFLRGLSADSGKIVAIRATNGAIRHTLFTAPSGCTGASVWGSPTLDTSTGDIYFATGNGNTTCTEPLSVAIVQANSDLSLLGRWQVPVSTHGPDSDFGSTPTLFTAGGRPMVGLQNKNGIYYAFDRRSISAGPVWQTLISRPGACPECGIGNIAPSAWDGSKLYVGGGRSDVDGTVCLGVVAALRPTNGQVIWQNCLKDGPVIGAVTGVPASSSPARGSSLMLSAQAMAQLCSASKMAAQVQTSGAWRQYPMALPT
jgi:hypothetical protein